MSSGFFLEKFHIVRKVPNQLIIPTNYAILGNCNNDGYIHLNSDFSFNMWMGIITLKNKILETKTKNILH